MADEKTTPKELKYERAAGAKDEAPGPGINEPSVFSGSDGLIIFDGEALARRVESSIEIALDWDEVYFQGQYTVGALVLKSIKISGGIKQATANLSVLRKFVGMHNAQNNGGKNAAGDIDASATIRDVRYIAPVDLILVLDKSMLPDTIRSYEAIMVFNAVMNSFSMPTTAASTVFNDQKWVGSNLSFKNAEKGPVLRGDRFLKDDYDNSRQMPDSGRATGTDFTTSW